MERHGSSASRAESASKATGVVLAVGVAWLNAAAGRDAIMIAREKREDRRGIVYGSEETR
jgi:hypothetical protein